MSEKLARLLRLDKIYRQPVTLLSRIHLWAIAVYGVGMGTFIASTNPARWDSSPSLAIIKQAMSYYVWASTCIAFGALVVAGLLTKSFYVRLVGHFGLSAWHFAFCLGTLSAFYTIPSAGNLGPGVYLFAAVVIALMTCIDESRPSLDFRGEAVKLDEALRTQVRQHLADNVGSSSDSDSTS